jgi:hypothetical protein
VPKLPFANTDLLWSEYPPRQSGKAEALWVRKSHHQKQSKLPMVFDKKNENYMAYSDRVTATHRRIKSIGC